MKQKTESRTGILLVILGIVAMVGQFIGFSFGFIPTILSRFWPLLPLAAGLTFVAVPSFKREPRGLGGMYIPGAILITNGLLLGASALFDWWSLWSWAWPLQFLGLAAGFTLAGLRLRVAELLIPASLMAVNWLLFQFSTISGQWDLWAYFWTLEIGAVALGLLLVGLIKRDKGITRGGLVVASVSLGFLFMMLIIGATAYLSLTIGALLTAAGLLTLAWNCLGRGSLATGSPIAPALKKEDIRSIEIFVNEEKITSPQ